MSVWSLPCCIIVFNPIVTLFPLFFVTSGPVCHLSPDHIISYLRARTLALSHLAFFRGENNTEEKRTLQCKMGIKMGSTGRE